MCPTRARLVCFLYDWQRQTYLPVPGAFLSAIVRNADELRRLLAGLLAVVEGGAWQDEAYQARVAALADAPEEGRGAGVTLRTVLD